MNQQNITLAKLLTYSGMLPLIGCAVAMLISMETIDVVLLARTYSAVIISFLCGIHWAAYLFFSEKCPRNLLITSNLVALIAWLSVVIAYHKMAFLIQIVCFVYLLILDIKLRDIGILPVWFYRLRRNATMIVVLAMLLIAVLS